MKKTMIILYVADQERSKKFYENILEKKAVLHVPGMTEFELTQDVLLGLMPEKGIAKILVPHVPDPAEGKGIPRCELYLFVQDPEYSFENALRNGAIKISATEIRSWGDTVAYCADPDGHIIAFAKA